MKYLEDLAKAIVSVGNTSECGATWELVLELDEEDTEVLKHFLRHLRSAS